MKRIGLVVLTIALAGVGCVPNPYLRDEQKPPPVQLKEAPVAGPVTPEGITGQNAAEKARQLREEMERDAKRQEKTATEQK